MKLNFDRVFHIMDSAETLSRNLEIWSKKENFICTREGLGNWEYRRGTYLSSSLSFDVRKLPTIVTIKVTGESPVKVDCSMSVKSWLHFETPSDKKKMENQMNSLVTQLQQRL